VTRSPVRIALWIVLTAILAPPILAEPVQATHGKDRGPIRLKVYTLPDPKRTDAPALADMAVIKAFRKWHLKNRGYEIQLVRFSGIAIDGMGMDSKPLLAIAGGMAADVLYVNFRQSHTYIAQGFIKPLDSYVAKLTQEQIDRRVPKPVLPVIHRAIEAGGEKHWWAMPYNVLVRTLLYRKDLFAKVGLDPSRGPKDWNELIEYSRIISRSGNGNYGALFKKGNGAAHDWITFLWSAGGRAVKLDKNGEWVCTFDDDAAVEAALFYVRLFSEKWTDATGRQRRGYVCTETRLQAYEKWDDGKIGMRINYLDERTIGGRAGIDPETTGIAPVPLGPTGLRGSELNCTMMGMFSDIKPRGGYTRKEVEQAAWDYMWFFGGWEAKKIRTKLFVEQGFGQFVNPIYLREFGYDEYLDLVPEEWVDVYEEAMKNGKPEPYGKNCQMVYRFMQLPLNECLRLEKNGELGTSDTERRVTIRRILEDAVQRANSDMIGIVSPEDRVFRDNVAWVVGLCMVTVFLIVLWRVWIIFTPKEITAKGGWQFYRFRWAYIIMLPAVLSILLWKYFPMIAGSVMTFQDYSILRPATSEWTGVRNLADVLWDRTWWSSLGKTLYYMGLMMGIGFPAPIILAILLAEVPKGKMFYRTIFYLPAVLSGMVVLYLWKLMYDKAPSGILNTIIGTVGIPPQEWLDDPSMAMVCCVIPTVWAAMGPGCLIYLAALKAVPDDLYEAADIDGCGFVAKIWHITLPTLKGLIIIQFIGQFIMSAQNTRMILVMTFGGPGETTKVAGLHIFEKAYLHLRFGSAITMAWMLGVVMLCFTTVQLKRLSRMEFTTADSRKAREGQG
jgi:ABC-type sugar transport system permease subunit/ABC-type glycerol-3-phosphate transport system substrate-binding protein